MLSTLKFVFYKYSEALAHYTASFWVPTSCVNRHTVLTWHYFIEIQICLTTLLLICLTTLPSPEIYLLWYHHSRTTVPTESRPNTLPPATDGWLPRSRGLSQCGEVQIQGNWEATSHQPLLGPSNSFSARLLRLRPGALGQTVIYLSPWGRSDIPSQLCMHLF